MEIKCQKCDTVILIDEEQLGQTSNCPGCGKKLGLPVKVVKKDPKQDPTFAEEEKLRAVTDTEEGHEKAEKMLEEPASKETQMWREKLTASFQAANHFAEDILESELPDEDEKMFFISVFLDNFLDSIRIKRQEKFDNYYKLITAVGILSLFVAFFLILTQGVILLVKIHGGYLVFGIIAAATTLVLNYLAYRFSRAGLQVVRKKKLTLNGYELLDAFGILGLLATFTLVIAGLYFGIKERNILLGAQLIVPAVASAHVAYLFLSPAVLNAIIARHKLTVGEAGLAVTSYLVRTIVILCGLMLAAIPFFDFVLLWNIANSFGPGSKIEIIAGQYVLVVYLITFFSLLPLFAYIFFLIYRIFLDFYDTVFRISKDLNVLGSHLVKQDLLRAEQEVRSDGDEEE